MKTTAKQKYPNAHGPPAFHPRTLTVSFPENSQVWITPKNAMAAAKNRPTKSWQARLTADADEATARFVASLQPYGPTGEVFLGSKLYVEEIGIRARLRRFVPRFLSGRVGL